jgi:hypothetical protein
MIHHEPHPNFDSPATQAFALEQRLSSCMAENAALHEQAMRLRLTDAEREAIKEACDEGRWYPQDYHHIRTMRALLRRVTL